MALFLLVNVYAVAVSVHAFSLTHGTDFLHELVFNSWAMLSLFFAANIGMAWRWWRA